MGRFVESAPEYGEAQGDPRLTRIITVAVGVFMTEGYEKSNLEMIAVRAGVSKATIYQYFGCKSDLFKSTVQSIVRERFKNFAEPLDIERDMNTTLVEFASNYMEMVNYPVYGGRAFFEIPRLIAASANHEHDSRLLYVQEFYKFCWPPLVRYFEAQIERGNLPRIDVQDCIELFFQLIYGFGYMIFDHARPDIASIKRKMTKQVRIFLKACEVLAEDGDEAAPTGIGVRESPAPPLRPRHFGFAAGDRPFARPGPQDTFQDVN